MWLVTILCLTGTILNCKKLKSCFMFWAIGNVLWLIYDMRSELYGRAFLDFVQLILAIYGPYAWSLNDENH